MKKEKVWKVIAVAGLLAVLAAGVIYGMQFGTMVPDAEEAANRGTDALDIVIPMMSDGEQIQINLQQDGSTTSDSSVRINRNCIVINKGGVYRISGTLTDGQIYVEVPNGQGNVTLVLAGVDITNLTDAAIYIENAEHTFIILENETINTLQSGSEMEILTGADTVNLKNVDENYSEYVAVNLRNVTGNHEDGKPGSYGNGDFRGQGGGRGDNNGNRGDFGGRGGFGEEVPGLLEGMNPGDGLPELPEGMNPGGGVPGLQGGMEPNQGMQGGMIPGASEESNQGNTNVAANSDDATGGALYSRDDLTIAGNGTLQIYGYINNGIHVTNHLSIQSGTFAIEAVNNGIKGKDSLSISGGDFTIRSGGDGMKSDDTTGEGYGTILITGGTYQIESGKDGIQAETTLEIRDGSFSILTGGGSAGVEFKQDNGWRRRGFGWDLQSENEESTKGIKSGTQLTISGGNFSVDSRDDAFHTNGSMVIKNGSFTVATGDDGFHADIELTIEDGEILISNSYEGVEANKILIAGGTLDITAADDGINANGGQPGFGWGLFRDNDTQMPELRFTGGDVVVYADGDGLDSNGDLIVDGGTIIVNGPDRSGNGALDVGTEIGGKCLVNGGTVLAIGSAGMAETFDEESGQYSFQYSFNSTYRAGDVITISDAGGNVLYQHTAVKSGSSVVFSSPELKERETYILQAGENRAEITLNSVSTSNGAKSRWGW